MEKLIFSYALNRLLITIAVICCTVLFADGQSTYSPKNVNNKIIPPPPNVASFIKIADVPVSTYNGTTQVAIPVYTIESGDLKVPVSLSYSSTGMKVTEEASWVGLGWNLNAGGVIHQNIVGNPDQLSITGSGNSSAAPLPLNVPAPSPNQSMNYTNSVQHGCAYVDSTGQEKYFTFDLIGANGAGAYMANNEYDIFLYNFGGYSGKFIIPSYPNEDPVPLDRNNIKFKYNGHTFNATTPDGTQYVFALIGKTTTPESSCFVNSPGPVSISYSYYLTKIVSPNGNVAEFVYKKYLSKTLAALSQSYSENQIGGSGFYPASQGFYRDFVFSFGSSSSSRSENSTYSVSTIENLMLDSIKTKTTIIKFNTSPRDDVDQGVKLDNISVYQIGKSSPIKGLEFNYSYFIGDQSFGDWMNDSNVILGCTDQSSILLTPPDVALRSKRLKLLTLQITGINNTSSSPYQFFYNNSPIPYKTSMAQDLWGYFNGQANHSLLPDYNNIGYFDNNLPVNLMKLSNKLLGIRRTYPQYLQAGILKTIVNPTGGYTKIIYEPNHFDNLPATNNQIRDTLVSVTDAFAGKKQLEFDVPDIGYQAVVSGTTPQSYNPAVLNIQLVNPESNNNTGCTVTPGFNAFNYINSDNANALYALLEKWDAANQKWVYSMDNIFDANNNGMAHSGMLCTVTNLSKQLTPGRYRITANYPDGKQGGLPMPSAFISVKYKYISARTFTNYGGGLRVKSSADYTDVNHAYNKKTYTYYSGKLMTKPIFYRNLLSFDMEYRALYASNQPEDYIGSVYVNCGSTTFFPHSPEASSPLELPIASVSLNSNPLLNYSYSASGGAVGYDSVKVDYSDAKEIGYTVLNYSNAADIVNYFPALSPGTSGASNLLNGTLLSTTDFKKNTGGTLIKLREESNIWEVNNFKDYWAYKSEYIPPYTPAGCNGVNGGGSPVPATGGASLYYNYLHFYPVKVGKVLLKRKTETFFDSSTPQTTITNYEYNNYNQVRLASRNTSDGRVAIQRTSYPGEYNVSTGAISTMKSKNMIDYPIEVINSISDQNNSSGNELANSAVYNEFYVHDGNIVNPLNKYTLTTSSPIAFAPSVNTNLKDSHYELNESYEYNNNGNLIKIQKANAPATRYLWDYAQTNPVVKIDNAVSNDFAYSSFEADGKGNWNYAGPTLADASSPIGKYCYNLGGGGISSPNMEPSKKYILSYWRNNSTPLTVPGTLANYPIISKNLPGWTCFIHIITGVSGINLNGSDLIDDLRLFPEEAEMSSYTYDQLIGLTTTTDSKGYTTYYKYDALQNLENVKDQKGNTLKSFEYKYAGNPSLGAVPYGNTLISKAFIRNTCPSGYAGGQVIYSVPANTYTSYISIDAANNLAQDDINENGQDYANLNGSCTLSPCVASNIVVNKTGPNSYSVTYSGAGSATSLLLSITDNNTGQGIQSPGLSSGGGTVNGTVPNTGRSYTFTVRAFGTNCTSGVLSNAVTVSF